MRYRRLASKNKCRGPCKCAYIRSIVSRLGSSVDFVISVESSNGPVDSRCNASFLFRRFVPKFFGVGGEKLRLSFVYCCVCVAMYVENSEKRK